MKPRIDSRWVVVAAAFWSGCSIPATIVKNDGVTFEASIEGGDPSSLHVRLDDRRCDLNPLVRIPRDEIRSIDHPGDVLAIAFTAIAALSLVPLGVGIADVEIGNDTGNPWQTLIGGLSALVGGAMFLSSGAIATPFWIMWARSRERARPDAPPFVPASQDGPVGSMRQGCGD